MSNTLELVIEKEIGLIQYLLAARPAYRETQAPAGEKKSPLLKIESRDVNFLRVSDNE